jgi:hypothetical protein
MEKSELLKKTEKLLGVEFEDDEIRVTENGLKAKNVKKGKRKDILTYVEISEGVVKKAFVKSIEKGDSDRKQAYKKRHI